MTYATCAIMIIIAVGLTLAASSAEPGFGQDRSLPYDVDVSMNVQDSDPAHAPYTPPLKQYHTGTDLKDIMCRPDMVLMQRPNLEPACVYNESVTMLEGREWLVKSSDNMNAAELGALSHVGNATTKYQTIHVTSKPLGDAESRKNIHTIGFPHVCTLPNAVSYTLPTAVKVGQQFDVIINMTFKMTQDQIVAYNTEYKRNVTDVIEIWENHCYESRKNVSILANPHITVSPAILETEFSRHGYYPKSTLKVHALNQTLEFGQDSIVFQMRVDKPDPDAYLMEFFWILVNSIYPSSSLGDPIYTHVSGDNVIFSETPHVLGAEQQSRYSQYDPSKTDIIQIPVQS